MKKIWLISYSLDGVMAGPSIRFQRYAPLFMEKGFRLVFITNWQDKSLSRYEERDYFDVWRINVKLKPFSRTRFITKALWLVLRKGGKRSNIFTFSLQTYQLWTLPLIRLFNCKLYYINTMAVNNQFVPLRSDFSKGWNYLHTLLYKILYNNINGVVTSTRTLADNFKVFALNKNKQIVINNGVDTEKFQPLSEKDKIDLRKKNNLAQNELIFLFVGLKTERKSIKELVEAWSSVKHLNLRAKLILIGDEKENANKHQFNSWWKEFKKNNEIDSRIVIRPGVNDISEYFQIADVFVFPSKKEGMPNVLLEAMSAGLPVIMNRFEGYSDDYGITGKTHILINIATNEFEAALSKLMTDDELRTVLGRQARSYALKFYAVNQSVSNYVSLVE